MTRSENTAAPQLSLDWQAMTIGLVGCPSSVISKPELRTTSIELCQKILGYLNVMTLRKWHLFVYVCVSHLVIDAAVLCQATSPARAATAHPRNEVFHSHGLLVLSYHRENNHISAFP